SMQEKMTEIVSELRLVGTRRHLNLVAMHTCVLTTDSLWSVCEYMEFGAVADALQVLDMLEMSEAVMARILRDAAQGIAFLNSVGLAHRDIRSDNLLVNAQGITKLTDMSHAAPLPLRLEALSYTTSRPMGAIYWLSPEATQRKPCDMTVDMWALGIVAYELMEGQPPHMEFPELKALYLISTNGAPPLKQNPDRCWSNEIRAFVAECTRFDCRQRPIAQDVLDMS
ncbi:kinase-like protein, partial [Ramicandelaber brevisporus]